MYCPFAKSLESRLKDDLKVEENAILIELVKQHGVKNLSLMASQISGKINNQPRERWSNQYPKVNKDAWTLEEDRLILIAHTIFCNRWAEIAKMLPGR